MAIVAGNDALAADFIGTSAGAGSSGQVPKCDAGGKLDLSFMPKITSSAGAGDSGKIPALNGSGQLDPTFVFNAFGGTGADGALSISSGTTTIALGGASYFEKNYSSISITGTGKLTFSNPSANGCIVVLKCTGNVTLTSSTVPLIEGSALGATAGNHGVSLGGLSPRAPHVLGLWVYPGGLGSPLTDYKVLASQGAYAVASPHLRMRVFCGSGGISPGGASVNNGAGAPGGIGLMIECRGALNFTGTIYSKGGDGAAGAGSTNWSGYWYIGSGGAGNTDGSDDGPRNQGTSGQNCGGGGGGGGCVCILANTITANTGTITITGGQGGAGTNGGQGGTDGLAYSGLNTIWP